MTKDLLNVNPGPVRLTAQEMLTDQCKVVVQAWLAKRRSLWNSWSNIYRNSGAAWTQIYEIAWYHEGVDAKHLEEHCVGIVHAPDPGNNRG